MAQTYKTGLIITGDASGGIRAIKATDDELGKLNQGFDRGARRSKQFTQNINGTSRELQMLRRAAAPIAGVIAGMFAANSLQNQINWGDQLQKTNLRIGASTEALSQYNYVASLSGVEFNQLTTAWQRQTRRIAEAAAGTGVAVAALDRLNLSAQELNQLAPEDQFERIAEAMQGVENSSERVRLAQQLWDSEGVKLVQIVNSGTDAIAAMRAEADALGLTISQDTANAMASYNDEVDRLKFAAQGVSQTLLSELVPAMTAGLQNVNAFIQEVGGAEVVVGHLTDGAQVLAALLAGRYAGAFATATAAKLAATQQSIAYQMALARMAGVSATAAGAQASLAAATRGAGAAMALVGGPLGAAMIAGGAIYYFREELGLVAPKVQTATERVDDMTSALDANSEAALKNARAMLEAERQFQQFQQARLAMEVNRQQQVVADEQEQWDAVGGQQAFGMGMRSEAQQKLHDLRLELLDTRQAIEAAGGSVTEIDEKLEALERTTRDVITPTTDLGDTTNTAAAASREAAKQTTTLANSYENLLDRIQPNRRAARQYAQDVGTLNLALATGRINAVQYMQAMGMLQEAFQAAQRETENTANAAEDASQRIANSFLSWETVADNTLRRIDDSGQSLWLGLIDGSESALDTVKRGFQQTLAEIAHMLTTQKLTFEVAGMMGLDTTGMPGGGGGFNLGSLGSLKNGWDTVSGWLGGGSAASGGLYSNAMTGSAAAGGLYSSAATGAAQGGLYGNALTGGVASGAGGLSSMMAAAGPALAIYAAASAGDSLLKNVGAYDALGIRTDGRSSQFLSQFMPIGGTIIGSGLDALGIGGRKTAPKFELATVGQGVDPTRHGLFENYGEGVFSRGALGTVGFADPGTARLEETFGGFENATAFLNQITAMDNALAGVAGSEQELSEMASAVQAVRLNAGDAAGIQDQLAKRTIAAANVIDAELTAALVNAGATAEQITQRFVSADAAMQLLGSSSDRLNLQFDAGADGAIRYADSIVAAVGGLDNLTNLQSSYYQQYFSEAERTANLQADLTAEFARYGAELPKTREEFRQMVEAQDLSTAAGQRNYAALLGVSSAFAELVPAADTSASSIESAASSIESAATRVEQAGADLLAPVETAWQALNKSVDAERQILDAAYRDTTASIRSNMSVVQDAMRETESASRSLQNALRQTQSGTMFAREQGQATLQRMLAAGEITSQRELDDALSAVAEPSEHLFGSFLDYQRDFVGTAHDIYNLSQLTDDQLSTEEQSLAALEKQLRNADLQHSREMARLDNLLMDQAAIIEAEFGTQDWLSTVNESVLSVAEAVRNIRISVITAGGGGGGGGSFGDVAGNLGGLTGGALGNVGGEKGPADSITRAYRDILGRDPDPEGLAYFQNDLANGQTIEDVRKSLEQNKAEGNYATGAWQLERDQLAMVHKNEFIAPDRGGIADEFRAYAAGDYQRELMSELCSIQRALPMPQLPAMPLFNQQNSSGSGDMTVLIKRVETLVSNADTQQGMQREALKALKSLVRQLERWDDQDRVRVSVEKTVEPTT